MRKPRSDSKLMSQLTEEQQAQLSDLMLSGTPYHALIPIIKKDFGVDTSMGALSAFWDAYCSVALIARRQRWVSVADDVADDAAREPGRFDAATITTIKQLAFELASSPGANPKDVKALFSLVLKSRDQEIAERRLEQTIREYEDRIAAAQKATTDAERGGGLTPEALLKIKQALRM